MLVGFITNRVQAKRTLLIMALVWSLVQFPMVGTVSIEVLIACRIVLGAGEDQNRHVECRQQRRGVGADGHALERADDPRGRRLQDQLAHAVDER